MTDRPRRFNARQRIALFVAAGGHCSSCGVALSQGWHADHIDPFSRGGDTDVLNGQAMCPRCNLKKGNRVTTFRLWQRDGFKAFDEKERINFLCSATPGAGKTTFALEIARRQLNAERVDRLVVVVPTTHLKRQWCDAASAIGIELDPKLTNGHASGETSDFKGCVVTYAQVGMQPDLHRMLCRVRTMVIFDEIHHAGDQRTWGDALRHAFDPAVLRLMLTGTPFREDGRPIPFVEYDIDGRCAVDVGYGYGDALRDGAVRNIVFPTFEGNMEWWSGKNGDMSANFADEIPSDEESRRLATALDPQGEWIRTVFRQADARLVEVRKSVYSAAAGLVIATDKAHARNLAIVLEKITGSTPVIALSDDSDASEKIAEFGKGGDSAPRWLIAVKMVSEGVDIPRLFVGVWATNTMTNLFFRQVVGRFVRLLPNVEDQTGYVFIPRVERLIEYVETIKHERDSALRTIEDPEEDDEETGDSWTNTPRQPPDWSPYRSTAIEDDTYIGGEAFGASEMADVRKFLVGVGLEGASPEIAALILRKHRQWSQDTSAGATPPVDPPPVRTNVVPVSQQRDRLKRQVTSLVNQYTQKRRDAGYEIDQKQVWTDLMRHHGVKQADCTVEQLKERITILSTWIDEVSRVRG